MAAARKNPGLVVRDPAPCSDALEHSPESPEAATASPGLAAVPWMLPLAVLIGCAWIVSLILLTGLTANPVIVSVPQVQQSDAVVTAVFSDQPAGNIEQVVIVERTWKGGLKPGEIKLARQQYPPHLERGRKYVLPLSRTGRMYSITRPAGQNIDSLPLIYPETSEVTDQVLQILTLPPPR